MPTTWFLAQYKRTTGTHLPGRYCVIADYQALIDADGGAWDGFEVLGGYAIVKARASAQTLTTIVNDPLVRRMPVDALQTPLSSLTSGQKTTLRNWITQLGYSVGELQTALGSDLGAVTLDQVLRFIATRRLQPRYDSPTDTIVLDGPVQPTGDIDALDTSVT